MWTGVLKAIVAAVGVVLIGTVASVTMGNATQSFDAVMTPPSPASCPPSRDSIQTIALDMTLGSEEHPHGVVGKSYGDRPRLNLGNNPGDFSALTGWGQVYASDKDTTGRAAAIEIKDMQVYLFERSTKTWRLEQSGSNVTGANYREDFADDDHIPARVYRGTDGNTIATLAPSRNFHFWPAGGRKPINPRDVGGLFVTVQARLVPDPGSAPRDLRWQDSHYVMSVGVDYWRDGASGWDHFKTNADAGIGRFKRVSSCWRAFTMTTLTPSQLAANPPPLD